jgi:hypothetical protein
MDGLPWDAVPEAVETIAEAARRHGRSPVWMRRRAVRSGLLRPQPVGRPKGGTGATLPVTTWDALAAPKVRRLVSIGSLESATGHDWRVILATAHSTGEAVFINAPGQRARYSVGAKAAVRIVASFRATDRDAARTSPLRRMAKECGVHEDALRTALADDGVPLERNARGRVVVDRESARAAVLRSMARETVRHAVQRTGVPLNTLRAMLLRAGVLPSNPKRRKSSLDPAVVDRVVAENRARRLNAAARADVE